VNKRPPRKFSRPSSRWRENVIVEHLTARSEATALMSAAESWEVACDLREARQLASVDLVLTLREWHAAGAKGHGWLILKAYKAASEVLAAENKLAAMGAPCDTPTPPECFEAISLMGDIAGALLEVRALSDSRETLPALRAALRMDEASHTPHQAAPRLADAERVRFTKFEIAKAEGRRPATAARAMRGLPADLDAPRRAIPQDGLFAAVAGHLGCSKHRVRAA
jgi:hypothetical protein